MHKLELTNDEYFALGLTLAIATRTRLHAINECIEMDLYFTAGMLASDLVKIERLSATVYGLPFPTADGEEKIIGR